MSKQCACGEREECDHSCMPDVIDGFCSYCGERVNGLPILPAGMTNELFYKEQAEYWRQIASQNQTPAPVQAAADAADAARYRYLKEHASYYYPEEHNPPSPREIGIEWHWQDGTPDRLGMDALIDREIEEKRVLAEVDADEGATLSSQDRA